ncbi:MAG: polysaccharide biosynthesis protein [bacterium]
MNHKHKIVANLKIQLQHSRPLAIMLFQMLLVVSGYVFAFGLAFDFQVSPAQVAMLVNTIFYLLFCRMFAYYLYKLNYGWWQFVSMRDLVNITKAVFLGTVLFIIGLVFGYNLREFYRSVVVIEAILNFVLLGGVRFAVRWLGETFSESKPKQVTYVLIVGAGKAGMQLLKEIRLNSKLGMQVIGFADDDPIKYHAYIQGVRVLGASRDLPKLVKKHAVDEVLISLPSAGRKRIRSIERSIQKCGVKIKVLPGLQDLIQKEGLWQQLIDVPYDELLPRQKLKFCRESDLKTLKQEITGKNVLITGAAGSIGSNLAYQTAKLKPEVLILYERNESALYFLELKLKKCFPKCELIGVIGDILDKEKLNQTVSRYHVDIIYHAAAYKHVPLMEREPFEAVRNNVFGTKLVAETAIANHVKKFVFISTDKAVNPSSIMGMTKRVAELVIQGLSGSACKFIIVRFGNVIGSNGSAMQLFKKQIAEGGPVTVTHPQVTRYFMRISEAVQLVMTAGAMGSGGEIFLLDMGKPLKISEIAKDLIRRSNLLPGKDIEIKYIGLRPGEKLHEELFWQGENIIPTNNKKITMLKSNGFCKEWFFSQLIRLQQIVKGKNPAELIEILQWLVPEGTLSTKNGRNGKSYPGKNGKSSYAFLKLPSNKINQITIVPR